MLPVMHELLAPLSDMAKDAKRAAPESDSCRERLSTARLLNSCLGQHAEAADFFVVPAILHTSARSCVSLRAIQQCASLLGRMRLLFDCPHAA